MPLTTTTKMLQDAQNRGYAVGAFNIENMEMAQAVMLAAEELNAPVIIQTTPSTVRYGSLPVYKAMVSALAMNVKVPVALHLDHGDCYDLAMQALEQGYTSIMIDGSYLNFNDNVELTRRVVSMAKPKGISVESELGKVGGKEDNLNGGTGEYTDPGMAKEFVDRTEISSLAVAIGTAHGVYTEAPRLDVDRLKKIRNAINVPLVLHGASGLTNEQVRECINNGICKVNFATELRKAYKTGLDVFLAEKPDVFDPKSYGAMSRDSVKQLVMDLILICGANNRADISK